MKPVSSQFERKNSEEWYLFTEDRLNLYMYEFGEGDSVLVLHGGFGAEHSYLLDVLTPLQGNFHFICFDQRGSLRSPAPDSLLNLPAMISDIELIRKEIGQTKLKILAHSMGTLLAMEYLRCYPENVQSLTLIGSFPPRADSQFIFERKYYKEGMASHYLSSREKVASVLKKEGLSNRDPKSLSAREKSRTWRINYAAVNIFHVDRFRQKKGGVAFYNQRTGNMLLNSGSVPVSWDYTTAINSSNVPLTVINGDHDYIDFTALADSVLLASSKTWLLKNGVTAGQIRKSYSWRDFNHTLPKLELVIVKNAGHNGWIDEPALFKVNIQRGLSK